LAVSLWGQRTPQLFGAMHEAGADAVPFLADFSIRNRTCVRYWVEEIMNEGKYDGRSLAALLGARMRSDGVSVKDLAIRLGISQSYFSQLLNGDKPITAVNDEFLRRSATYLELPAVISYLLAGRLRSEDFFEAPQSFPALLASALKVVSTSRHAQEVVVTFEQLTALEAPIQHLVVLLYEVATGAELIPGRVGWRSVDLAGQRRMPFEVRVVRPR